MKEISFLIKPASSLCNLRCIYCFYKDEADLRNKSSYGVMDNTTTHSLIDKALGCGAEKINFCFQGGEPTVAGYQYFDEFIEYVKANLKNQLVTYAIQTNLTLLNDEFLRIYKDNDFLVGVSPDGFIDNHDYFRKDGEGNGSFDVILANIEKLKEYNIRYNILTVLTKKLALKPNKLFDFYLRNDFKYVQIIPCLPSLDDNPIMNKLTLKPNDFSSFYKKFFDRWFEEYIKGNYISVTLFDDVIPMYKGVTPNQCGMLGKCHLQFVVEADGGVYPCDFYVLDEYRLGNISDNSIDELIHTSKADAFLKHRRTLSNCCKGCPFIRMCNGNCRRLSACYYSENYCGYRDFLEYSYSRMLEIAKTLN